MSKQTAKNAEQMLDLTKRKTRGNHKSNGECQSGLCNEDKEGVHERTGGLINAALLVSWKLFIVPSGCGDPQPSADRVRLIAAWYVPFREFVDRAG